MNPLIGLIPPSLVRVFARPYVAGDSLQMAMDSSAVILVERGLLATLDLLAEDIEDAETVERNIETYLAMIDAAADDPRFPSDQRPTISLKLSSYTTDPLDRGGEAVTSREAVFQIAEHAKGRGIGLTVDMEGTAWTDFTLEVLSDLHRAGYRDVGAVLQTRLHRTADDLERLPPGCRVRLVIGIYEEPASVALTKKSEMKQRMLDHARTLLERGHYVEFATHDERYVKRFVDEVVPAAGVERDRYELQMFYGVPRMRLLGQMAERGIRGRLYVPFATSWPRAVAYLRRRLDEYPAMIFLVLKNLLLRK